MTKEQCMAILTQSKDVPVTIEWVREVKLRKKDASTGAPITGHTCFKNTTGERLLIGECYSNRPEVKAARAAGQPEGSLSGMEYIVYPYLARSVKTGQLYLAVNTQPDPDDESKILSSFKTEWLLDDEPKSKDELLNMLLSGDAKPSSGTHPTFFWLRLEDIVSISPSSGSGVTYKF